MKTITTLLLMLLGSTLFAAEPPAKLPDPTPTALHTNSNPLTYEKFMKEYVNHRRKTRLEGISYFSGGLLGLSSSLYLSITGKETLSKLGYTFIQTLSAGAMVYGGILYFTGDEFTREMEGLTDVHRILMSEARLSPTERDQMLNEATTKSYERALKRRKKVHLVRGSLQLFTAGTTALTLALTDSPGTTTQLTMGFVILVAAAGGLSDLFSAEMPFSADVYVSNDTTQGGFNSGMLVTFRW